MKKAVLLLMLLLSVVVFGQQGMAATVVDVLNNANANEGESTTNYASHTFACASGAEYASQCAGEGGTIQIRSNNNNSGIVVTKSVGIVKSITIKFSSKTNSARIVNVYGSNTAYASPSALYSGSYVTQIKYSVGAQQTYTFTTDYAYVGIRSSSGAIYLDEVDIEWETGGGEDPEEGPVAPVFTLGDGTEVSGSVEVAAGTAITATSETVGAELVLTASPAEAASIEGNTATINGACTLTATATLNEQSESTELGVTIKSDDPTPEGKEVYKLFTGDPSVLEAGMEVILAYETNAVSSVSSSKFLPATITLNSGKTEITNVGDAYVFTLEGNNASGWKFKGPSGYITVTASSTSVNYSGSTTATATITSEANNTYKLWFSNNTDKKRALMWSSGNNCFRHYSTSQSGYYYLNIYYKTVTGGGEEPEEGPVAPVFTLGDGTEVSGSVEVAAGTTITATSETAGAELALTASPAEAASIDGNTATITEACTLTATATLNGQTESTALEVTIKAETPITGGAVYKLFTGAPSELKAGMEVILAHETNAVSTCENTRFNPATIELNSEGTEITNIGDAYVFTLEGDNASGWKFRGPSGYITVADSETDVDYSATTEELVTITSEGDDTFRLSFSNNNKEENKRALMWTSQYSYFRHYIPGNSQYHFLKIYYKATALSESKAMQLLELTAIGKTKFASYLGSENAGFIDESPCYVTNEAGIGGQYYVMKESGNEIKLAALTENMEVRALIDYRPTSATSDGVNVKWTTDYLVQALEESEFARVVGGATLVGNGDEAISEEEISGAVYVNGLLDGIALKRVSVNEGELSKVYRCAKVAREGVVGTDDIEVAIQYTLSGVNTEKSRQISVTPMLPSVYGGWYTYTYEEDDASLADTYATDYVKLKVKSNVQQDGMGNPKESEVLVPTSEVSNRHLNALVTFCRPNVSNEILQNNEIYYTIAISDATGNISGSGVYADREHVLIEEASYYQFTISDVSPAGGENPQVEVLATQYVKNNSDVAVEGFTSNYGGTINTTVAKQPMFGQGAVGKVHIGTLAPGASDLSGNENNGSGYALIYKGHNELTAPSDVLHEEEDQESVVVTPEYYHIEVYTGTRSDYASYEYLVKLGDGGEADAPGLEFASDGSFITDDVDNVLLGTYIAKDFTTTSDLYVSFTPVYVFSHAPVAVANSDLSSGISPIEKVSELPVVVAYDAPNVGSQATKGTTLGASESAPDLSEIAPMRHAGLTDMSAANITDLTSSSIVVLSGNSVKRSLGGDEVTGVENVVVECPIGEVEYYNLQGVRLSEPKGGVYIEVKNGKATKVVK